MEERLIQTMLGNNVRLTTTIINDVDKKIKASEERLLEQMSEDKQELKQELTQEIRASQVDTIDALTTVMDINYNDHEARIKRVEKELHLPPMKQN